MKLSFFSTEITTVAIPITVEGRIYLCCSRAEQVHRLAEFSKKDDKKSKYFRRIGAGRKGKQRRLKY